jgi:hypothetical protein
MLQIREVVARIRPDRTVLFLGAGASIPSGAPAGSELAKELWSRLAKSEADSDDLMEVCSLLERRFGRRELVECVRSILGDREPVGMLHDLPRYGWSNLYTTNVDTLIEKVFARAGRPVASIVSNYDYGRLELSDGPKLFKLHGSLEHDVVDGSPARLVLTETDYEDYEDYRQVLYANLKLDLLTKNAIIVGYSLSDPHLRKTLIDAAKIQRQGGLGGRIFLLIYRRDEDRARLWEDRGFFVCFGGIDDLLGELALGGAPVAIVEEARPGEIILSPNLRARTLVVAEEATLRASAAELFNGRAASYADIAVGLTFERQLEQDIISSVTSDAKRFVGIIGVAGVGKSTIARRVTMRLRASGWLAWEHKIDLPLRASDWLRIDDALVAQSRDGVVLIDECTPFLGQVNLLIARLAERASSRLRLLLTANRANWTPRVKSPQFYAKGLDLQLSDLTNHDLNELLRLLDASGEIRSLVSVGFLALPAGERFRRLRDRCGADMYVCLKNIFATEGLDAILLRELAALAGYQRDVYTTVCALQSVAEHVHRQLVLRFLPIAAERVSGLVAELEGLINEYDISAVEGIFGWSARHLVIAQTITRYEYADQSMVYELLAKTIDCLVPTVPVELMAIRSLCNSEFGISSLLDPNRRTELYRRLIAKAPGERIPHHRLISTLLQRDELDGADHAIRAAEEAIGEDRPIARYKVRLLVRRALRTEGILREHRVAMLRGAEREALQKLERFPLDKHQYRAYGEVGLAFAEVAGEMGVLEDAIARMKQAAGRILEPEMLRDLQRLENDRKRFS